MQKIVFSTLIVLGLSSAAFAQTPTTFADVDGDTSGELSFAELQVVWPDLSQAEFEAADADTSAGLNVSELNSLQPAAVPAPTEAAPEAVPAPL
jgi:hypothetical protein